MSKDLHVRLPEDLHEVLKAQGQRMGLSLNAQIISALRQWQAQQERKEQS
jgi:predicted HicB family RNase H-like nuclease